MYFGFKYFTGLLGFIASFAVCFLFCVETTFPVYSTFYISIQIWVSL